MRVILLAVGRMKQGPETELVARYLQARRNRPAASSGCAASKSSKSGKAARAMPASA